MSLTPRLDNLDRNAIINGGFNRWQRAGATVAVNTTTAFAYYADRWQSRHTGTFTGTPNLVRVATPPTTRSIFALQHTFQRNASTAVLEHQQKIESTVAQQLVAFGAGSFSIKVRSTLATGFVRVRLLFPTAADNYASSSEFYNSGLIAVPNAAAWQEVKAENVSIPAGASNGINLLIEYSLPSATDGATQTLMISEVMFNAGEFASNFVPAGGDSIAEIERCQRYYEKTYDLDTVPGTVTFTGAHSFNHPGGVGVEGNYYYRATKRVLATVTFYSPQTGAAGQFRDTTSGVDRATSQLRTGVNNIAFVTSGVPAGAPDIAGQMTFDAEIA